MATTATKSDAISDTTTQEIGKAVERFHTGDLKKI
jgi:hypothetical protein